MVALVFVGSFDRPGCDLLVDEPRAALSDWQANQMCRRSLVFVHFHSVALFVLGNLVEPLYFVKFRVAEALLLTDRFDNLLVFDHFDSIEMAMARTVEGTHLADKPGVSSVDKRTGQDKELAVDVAAAVVRLPFGSTDFSHRTLWQFCVAFVPPKPVAAGDLEAFDPVGVQRDTQWTRARIAPTVTLIVDVAGVAVFVVAVVAAAVLQKHLDVKVLVENRLVVVAGAVPELGSTLVAAVEAAADDQEGMKLQEDYSAADGVPEKRHE